MRHGVHEPKYQRNKIKIDLNVDGNGRGRHLQTGLGFFDHMLDQIARHGKNESEYCRGREI